MADPEFSNTTETNETTETTAALKTLQDEHFRMMNSINTHNTSERCLMNVRKYLQDLDARGYINLPKPIKTGETFGRRAIDFGAMIKRNEQKPDPKRNGMSCHNLQGFSNKPEILAPILDNDTHCQMRTLCLSKPYYRDKRSGKLCKHSERQAGHVATITRTHEGYIVKDNTAAGAGDTPYGPKTFYLDAYCKRFLRAGYRLDAAMGLPVNISNGNV